MRYAIFYLVGLAIVMFLSRNYIKGWILSLKEKYQKKEKLKKIDPDFVYVPILSSRTFSFTIEITELGDGKATISVVKQR